MNYQLDPEPDGTLLPPAVRRGIAQADPADVGPRDWVPVCLALRDEADAIIGGLYGATMWRWLMIDGLWVDAALRGQGLGRRLLLAAEEIAVERGCVGSSLGAFDFMAKGFYERHGYTVYGALEGFPPGHTHFQLQKRFP